MKPISTLLREIGYQTGYQNHGLNFTLNITAFGIGTLLGMGQEEARLALLYNTRLRKAQLLAKEIELSAINDAMLAVNTKKERRAAYLLYKTMGLAFQLSSSVNLEIIIWNCFLNIYRTLWEGYLAERKR